MQIGSYVNSGYYPFYQSKKNAKYDVDITFPQVETAFFSRANENLSGAVTVREQANMAGNFFDQYRSDRGVVQEYYSANALGIVSSKAYWLSKFEETVAKRITGDTEGKDPVSEEILSRLFVELDQSGEPAAGYTRSTFSGAGPDALDKVFYTFYSPEGIKCIREGKRNPDNPGEKTGEDKLQWEMQFDSPEQYDKLKDFLAQFREGDNLRFTANEDFWKDFFADKIDMDGFMDFHAWTDGGKPNFGIGENGEPVSLNKERMRDPNAEYFNDQTMVANVWTEEEMWEMWYARAEALRAGHKAEGSIPVGGTVTGGSQIVFAGALESENRYFRYADERGVIDYKGIIFYCDTQTDTLKLGDCSDASACIQISLTEGGSLMVNRNNLDQLFDALSFFSPEDMVKILQVLQKEKMSENSLAKIEQEEDKLLKLVKDKDAKEKKIARDYREQTFDKEIGIATSYIGKVLKNHFGRQEEGEE